MRLALALTLLLSASPAFADTLSGIPRLIDGDTLAFGRDHVRLAGIDAPETRQSCADANGLAYACGVVARAALTAEIAGRSVTCIGTERDRYGRLVATCWIGVSGVAVDLGRWMTAHGLAVAYRRYSLAYVDAEDAARQARIGVWAGTIEMPWDFRAGR